MRDPYTKKETLSVLFKKIEKRWGLTLVAFLPSESQKKIVHIQNEIFLLMKETLKSENGYINFYSPEEFHCTFLTLVPSNTRGSIKLQEFVKPGHNLYELLEIIQRTSFQVSPISVTLNSLQIPSNGIDFLIEGKVNKESERDMKFFMNNIYRDLQTSFNISLQRHLTEKCNFLHCQIGFLKRQLPDYSVFPQIIHSIKFEPITFQINQISIIHHRYRSLLPPHEGEFSLLLGVKIDDSNREDFIKSLNLEQ